MFSWSEPVAWLWTLRPLTWKCTQSVPMTVLMLRCTLNGCLEKTSSWVRQNLFTIFERFFPSLRSSRSHGNAASFLLCQTRPGLPALLLLWTVWSASWRSSGSRCFAAPSFFTFLSTQYFPRWVFWPSARSLVSHSRTTVTRVFCSLFACFFMGSLVSISCLPAGTSGNSLWF